MSGESMSINLQGFDFNTYVNKGMSTGDMIWSIVIVIWTIVCHWMMFKKAGLPGWGAIIPFYNIYLRFKMSGMSGWWVLSLLFPPLFFVVYLVSIFKLPAKFGRHWVWGIGFFFFYPIFIGIFAFDKSKYVH